MTKPGLGLLLLLAASGCGMLEFTEGPRPEQPPTPPVSEPDKKTEQCQWQHTRGIAQLLEWLNGDAQFEFFPGEKTVAAPGKSHWQEGDEFKAELREAQQTGCETTLIIMDPLE